MSVFLRYVGTGKARHPVSWYYEFQYKEERYRDRIGPPTMTQKEAEDVEKVVKAAVVQGRYGIGLRKPVVPRLSEAIVRFFQYYETNRAPSSYRRYAMSWRAVEPHLGRKRLDEITPDLIERFKATRRQSGLSNVTINRDVAFLKHFFTMAITWELVTVNPVKAVGMLQEGKRTRYLSEAEATRLLQACPPYLLDLVIAAIHTGCRPEELLSLVWRHVDFEHRIVTVHWSYSKTHETRSIAMNEILTQTLQAIRLKTSDTSLDALVFRNARGQPYRSPRTAFETALKRAQIEDFTFYDLRHTFGSWLIMAGEDIRTVKELMGHRHITMTDRYTHLSQRHLRTAVEKLSSHMSPHTPTVSGTDELGTPVRKDLEG